jgi:acyl-CoA synthetase (AMP-forming)/AMP-acid ligase II
MPETEDIPETLPGLAAWAAKHFGAAPAVLEEGRRWSFAEIYTEARKAAGAFIQTGLKPGDVLALWAPNRSEWIFAALGAQIAGAAITPLNTRLKGIEVADILARTRARFLLMEQSFLGTDYPSLIADAALPDLTRRIVFGQSTGHVISWIDLLASGGVSESTVDAAMASRRPDELSDIMFTSGTTGRPKGVLSTHGQTLRAFRSWTSAVDLRQGDRYLCINPFFHAFGYKAGWVSCLLRGATLLPMKVFDVQQAAALIEAERITFLPGPPTIFQSLLAAATHETRNFSSLRVGVTGAATIAPSLIERMHRNLGFKSVITGYGLTESSGVVSMCRQGDTIEQVAFTCGRPIDGVEVRCIDDTGHTVAAGESGEILVRGYNVMQGYLDDAAATAEAIDAEGWLHTGDIGSIDAEGYLRITDRKKDMYISGGFNCYPAEIERLLAAHPHIEAAAIIGVPDERLGEVGKAFVLLRHGEHSTPEEIIAWSREQMANYKAPRYVELVGAMPLTASGKVMRAALNREGNK